MTPPPTKPYKAVAAFVLAFIAAFVATLQGRPTLDNMKLIDWVIIVGGALVTAGTVYGVTNPPKAT